MKVILISALLKKDKNSEDNTSLNELFRLAETAGLQPIEKIIITMQQWNPSTFIGSGKTEDLKNTIKTLNADAVIFDEELKPAQQRNLENILGVPVYTRTRLIIEIFSERAKTKEGKLQALLAEYSYELTRLTGRGISMDQQHGMIGTRGAGERKKEYDRRTLRGKITDLEKEINEIRKNRAIQRRKRDSVPMPQIAIVGYTNAGKSTLLNALTFNKHSIYADDKLFATLDPSTKRVHMPSGGCVLFTDTVGFIQKLPHSLIAAFRATLEEIRYSDLIIHLHDASSPDVKSQHDSVKETLNEIGIQNIPTINVFNKTDAVKDKNFIWAPLSLKPVFISSLKKEGLTELLELCEKILLVRRAEYKISIPNEKLSILNFIYSAAVVKSINTGINTSEIEFTSTVENYKRILQKINS